MRKYAVLIFIVALTSMLFAQERHVGEGNSYSEFPYIVYVGQVVDVTPFSVTFENTLYGTRATKDGMSRLIEKLNMEPDYRSHGMANALRAVSIENGKMRVTFYIDNIFRIFSDDVSTYMKYIPLYYLFRNNIKEMMLPEKTMESLMKHSADYYLSLPMAQELMQNSWLAGVFQIDPDNEKLIYKSARFFDNFEELEQSEWAAEYRIADIVKAGLAVSMTKAVFIGHESQNQPEGDTKDRKSKKGKGKFDNRKAMPTGQEK